MDAEVKTLLNEKQIVVPVMKQKEPSHVLCLFLSHRIIGSLKDLSTVRMIQLSGVKGVLRKDAYLSFSERK